MTENKETEAAQVLMPDDSVFSGKHVIDSSMLAQGQTFHAYDHTEYPPEGGIYVYYKQMPFPKKGFPFPEAVWTNDVIKRMSATIVKSIMMKETAMPMLLVALYPWKMKIKIFQKVLINYCRMTSWLHASIAIKDERMSNASRSINQIIRIFFENLGMGIGQKFAKSIALTVEYDDAYRYRIEDIMSETSRQAMIDMPFREIRKLSKIIKQRERTHALEILRMVINFASISMLHPKVRRAWRKTMRSITDKEFNMLKLDNADRYHVLLRNDYDFVGKTFEERKKIYQDFHREKNLPYPLEITITA